MSVQIKGYYIRTTDNIRTCDAHPLVEPIQPGQDYVRVLRADGTTIEFYHPECFEEEFGIDPSSKSAFRHG